MKLDLVVVYPTIKIYSFLISFGNHIFLHINWLKLYFYAMEFYRLIIEKTSCITTDTVTTPSRKKTPCCWGTLFWENDTSESWRDWGSKQHLFLDKHLGILLYSYSEFGFANETFPALVGGLTFYISFLLFACADPAMSKSYFVFNIVQYGKDMFTWRSKLSHHHECRPNHRKDSP